MGYSTNNNNNSKKSNIVSSDTVRFSYNANIQIYLFLLLFYFYFVHSIRLGKQFYDFKLFTIITGNI